MLNITDFEIIVGDTTDDNDCYVLTALELGLSDGETMRVAPDQDSLVEALTSKLRSLNGGSLNFADSVKTEAGDDWVQWARECLKEAKLNIKQPSETVEEPDNELHGDIEGSDPDVEVKESEVGEGSEVKVEGGAKEVIKEAEDRPKYTRAGAKKPWEVNGWVEGKVLATVKNHRKHGWGRCEYRVLCLPEGRYRLIYFAGNREDMEVGTEWSHAQAMFRSLLGQDPEANTIVAKCGRRQGTRMTIRQFFGDSRRKK